MSNVELTVPRAGVALLRINRPQARNALSLELRIEFSRMLGELDEDEDVRVIVLAGSEKVFAAGADLRELMDARPTDTKLEHMQVIWQAMRRCRKPVLAAVRGICVGGGCELAMAADIMIVGESARLGQPEVKVGIMPGAGGLQRVYRLAGKSMAMQMALTGQLIDGPTAARAGLASEVVPDEQVLDRTLEIAETIAGMSPFAVRQIKEIMLMGADAPIEVALTLERKALQMMFGSPHQQEGMKAFLEKRAPRFEGTGRR